jgi:hypothetical protein
MPRRMFLAALLLACTAEATGGPDDPWHGELATYVIDRSSGVELRHRLRTADGTERPLLFAGAPSLSPGTHLRVWGQPEGEAIRVSHYEADSTPAAITSALLAAPAKPTRRWAFVLVDVDGGGAMVDKAKAQSVLFGADRLDSIRNYFREVSYGTQDLEGQVFGPFPYQMGGRCDTDRLARALLPKIDGNFDQYLWFFGKTQTACDWAGIADLGRADRPTKHSWYNGFDQCNVLVQEPGHNFGMLHSSAMRCTLAGQPVPIAWPDQDTAACKHIEYGNPFDPMGGGDCFHMNGVQKAYQDWLSGCNVIKASSSGTFTIYPLESACDGPQLLQIPFPAPRPFSNAGRLTSYYLELRTATGFWDRRLRPEVLVMVADDVSEARYTGNNNWLLDMTPETNQPGDEPLQVGKPFADALPRGPKFTLVSVDATKAVIQVELGGQAAPAGSDGQATCSDGSGYQPKAPVRCVAPASMSAGKADGGTPETEVDASAPNALDARAGQRRDAGTTAEPDETDEPTPRNHAPSTGCAMGGTTRAGSATLLLLALLARVRPRRRCPRNRTGGTS